MIDDIQKLKQDAMDNMFFNPSVVLQLIYRLEAAEKSAKSWEESAQALATQDNKVITDLSQYISVLESNQVLSASARQFKQMEERLEAAEQDAARYQWLRSNPDWETYSTGEPIVFVTCDPAAIPAQGVELDNAVDLAMKERP